MNNNNKIKRTFRGVVVSAAMSKTIVVKVEQIKVHPRYHKRFVINRKFKVHDEKNLAKIGDSVSFIECRPLSKEKRWRLQSVNK
jgi:small subunit ribosomal protein S17